MTAPKTPPKPRNKWPLLSVLRAFPRVGKAGSRSAALHKRGVTRHSGALVGGMEHNRFAVLRWLGLVGTLFIGLGGLGGGALPVIGNPWFDLPGGAFMGRMMQASSAIVFIGVGLMVLSWALMGPFVGAASNQSRVNPRTIVRTFTVWSIPLLFTAPLFTQDIYSYLANGAIVRAGLDPYSAGPVEILGTDHPLARSVPFIWAHSPSPYGPVALGIAAAISWLTNDSIVLGVLCHRLISLAGVLAAAWGIVAISRRCHVPASTALWLGILNPLTMLHLIGGIHNEAIMLGFILVGFELGLRGIDSYTINRQVGLLLLAASSVLLACAGMVKVSGFLALGFIGMAFARKIGGLAGIVRAAVFQVVVLIGSTVAITLLTGIGFGWISGQGGAATIRSWLSVTTDISIFAGYIGMWLGLGDHIDAMLLVTRGAGLILATLFLLRMLWATFKGTIHPAGGLGVATLVLVLLFPVVHPWYPLWAIFPLAAWANRFFFRASVALYSCIFSFLVLPRGLTLPANAVVTIYGSAFICFFGLVCIGLLCFRKCGRGTLH